MESKTIYIETAKRLNLGNLTTVKGGTAKRKELITLCADGYVDATENKDELLRSAYFSALVLLFWGEIGKQLEIGKAIDNDFEYWRGKVEDCILEALDEHTWKLGTTNAEQCIRIKLATRGANLEIQKYNKDKYKANINTVDLDSPLGSSEDDTCIIDTIGNDDDTKVKATLDVMFLIQKYLNENKVIEGIIFDTVVKNDCFKKGKVWSYQAVKALGSLPDNFKEYFKHKYNVKDEILDISLADIQNSGNARLTKLVEKTFSSAQKAYASQSNRSR